MTTEQRLGWLQAFFTVLVLWGLNYVAFGYSKTVLGANTVVFVCSTFASAALVLLLAGGRGPLVRETLRSIDTWVFGFILLTGYILLMTLVTYVSSTESSLLQRVSVVFGIFISWLFFSRKPNGLQILGMSCVAGGITAIFMSINPLDQGMVLLLLILVGATEALRMFVAESHRPHQAAMSLQHDPRAKARVVGFVMFIISVIFFALFVLLSLFVSMNGVVAPLPLIPQLHDFTDPHSIFAGLVVGGVLVAPLRLIEFSVTARIKTENFLAVAGLSSLATLFWEWSLSPLTGMSLREFTSGDVLALALVTAGAVIAAFGKMKQPEKALPSEKYLQRCPQDVSAIEDTRDLVAHTLEYAEGSTKKGAALLGLPVEVLQELLEDDSQSLALQPRIYLEVVRRYRQNVVHTDALTGLTNRAAFMSLLEGALRRQQPCSLIYMDLNHFKPVNDRYGHKAGDEVLRTIGQRLNSLAVGGVVAARLGGDEFVWLNPGAKVTKQLLAALHKTISAPISLASGVTVTVTVSLGVAHFPADAQTPQDLIALADQAMYHNKTAD